MHLFRDECKREKEIWEPMMKVPAEQPTALVIGAMAASDSSAHRPATML